MGIEAYPIEIEADVSRGLPAEVVVGLPDAAVKESKDRVRSAMTNSGFRYPDDKITVNLAPADIKKEGPSFDLPIALGILAASNQMAAEDLSPHLILGELALDGAVRPVRGMLSIALMGTKSFVKVMVFSRRARGDDAKLLQPGALVGLTLEKLDGGACLSPKRIKQL